MEDDGGVIERLARSDRQGGSVHYPAFRTAVEEIGWLRGRLRSLRAKGVVAIATRRDIPLQVLSGTSCVARLDREITFASDDVAGIRLPPYAVGVLLRRFADGSVPTVVVQAIRAVTWVGTSIFANGGSSRRFR